MKITILKSFKFAKVTYKAGQTSPSKRYPKIPFDSIQQNVLKDMGNISITEEIKTAPKVIKDKVEK